MAAPLRRAWRQAPLTRASDSDRDRALGALRDHFADGRLAQDSFVARVDAMLHAPRHGELAGLLADLPERRARITALLLAARAGAGRAADAAVLRARALRQHLVRSGNAQPLRLVLPPAAGKYTIGRDLGCDLVLADRTVSRRHADLRPAPGGWLLTDLSSTNGTWVNGWRVSDSVPLRPGDLVSFGTLTLRVAESAR